ncbi:MAG TPA: transglycosylase domain-containing protein [bacterium]|nr:transglycosylase domain-containing protein [bacterium]
MKYDPDELLLRPDETPRWRNVLNAIVVSVVGLAILAVIVAVMIYNLLSIGLPKLDTIEDYRPNLVTEVFDRHGVKIGEFKFENQSRFLVAYDEVPTHVVQAFVSAEDKEFFAHQGLDYFGIARAALANVFAGEIKQGASTITQQVVKSLLLTPEKTYRRKLREMILAKRIEDSFSKEEILYLYLNEIYFGGGAYGVEAAAREFFAKPVADLNVAEAATLAGLVQAPGRYNPRAHPERAINRRHYVLRRMLEDGHIDEQTFQSADAAPLHIVPNRDINSELAPDFVEYVRRYLLTKYDTDRVLKEGWQVHTTCDLAMQRAARDAVDVGLRAHAKRQGVLRLPPPVPPEQWNDRRESLMEQNKGLTEEQVREGLVIAIYDQAGWAKIALGDETIRVPLSNMKWVRQVKHDGAKARPVARVERPGQVLAPGDRVLVYKPKDQMYVLAAWPLAQGALLAMDVDTREVLAMIGGRSYAESQFNRAVQARRQPGSAFKPIVYAAALNARLTPATVFPDTALVFADNWRPANYDRKFRGYMNLREALTRSINTITIRVAETIGVDYILRFARRVGLDELESGDLSMAIGTYEVSPLHLVNAYDVFASGGKLTDPVFVRKVLDRNENTKEEVAYSEFVEQVPALDNVPDLSGFNGKELPLDAAQTGIDPLTESRRGEFFGDFELGATPTPPPAATPTPEPQGELPLAVRLSDQVVMRQVVDPQVAYVITSMMHSVASRGTGARSNQLGRTLAGKTGTTNNYADAWFVGFSPQIIAGVWVGNDNGGVSLGSGESGSTTALPIWVDFMRVALADLPKATFPVPKGVSFARIDPETGLLAQPDSPGEEECFVAGTEPTQYAPSLVQPDANDFFELELEGE